ncbi:MAG TPA: TspO/MBR family protein [Candidatus Acidoferrum sp.]|nr:TspO/MBR family protein [Candidatus Acidoferrum sp.]
MLNRASWMSLIPFLAICLGAAGLGAVVTNRAAQVWRPGLQMPDWNPPNWVFGPVWTFLYTLMALSVWLVWKQGTWRDVGGALALFWIQLALNCAWSFLFFERRAIGPAFAEILLLWTMTIATAVAFLSISFLAAWLLIPYIVWVGFASYLNFRIWQMN